MDKNMIGGDLGSLSPEDQARMSAIIDQLQISDSLKTYNGIVEKCFTECVETFYRKTLNKREENCVMSCAEKFVKLTLRSRSRFAEVTQGTSTSD
ncbi:mitochondrial import inner membrane translocase subunit Tim9-like [Rutidosis leptorrhynchoides]|uniref:mitochondrial import inner membrane translocase subunit Tim9-like n=1 Tax=Rutidosis leptorrhynchoides TaxID=125765 RepID=UPI003A9A468E